MKETEREREKTPSDDIFEPVKDWHDLAETGPALFRNGLRHLPVPFNQSYNSFRVGIPEGKRGFWMEMGTKIDD